MKPFLASALFIFAFTGLVGLCVHGAESAGTLAGTDKSEETPEGGDEQNTGNELDQLLKDAEKERLVYSPDKKLVAHLGQHLITVWSVETKRRFHEFVLHGKALAAAFSPDGVSLVTADGKGNLEYISTIRLWSLATGDGRLIAQLLGTTTHLTFSPDGSRLGATSRLNFIGSITRKAGSTVDSDRIQTGGSIYVWQLSDGDVLLKVDIELPDYSAKLRQYRRAVADDPDHYKGKKSTDILVPAYQEAVWNRVPIRLNFSPDGKRMIAVSSSGRETIFDSKTGKPLRPALNGDQPKTDAESKPKVDKNPIP
jgi:WD40 repeat protein